ncbi:mycofactocin-coupled SDR family oxidoreductase [Frankia sp. CNm7]|uniref:Mycofactocin-coupled SDR family oxidoreductase n=1 Tax=Frankia nepalensis TaxID=1836974 RepID=A0A937RLU8_9ACTN|nr:mycofactocin-coupled SDR family oxidoreductase [Frankia nepalensis]MBL7498830.1 mycofactocin-coupled SDR family oxidoreductase [Frankia nepalensis]MBL7508635.1 mycofactocin-coupled SDR family oxidoreductase [Frankia nepalensis]MBL7519272.1 mycofactocin-coupled SDR family oxidoreductase [Frankia nepalensis]MBL7629694.1 mycofactocin-coupled SDR family oxidoreductase [Frankia nepalensis]
MSAGSGRVAGKVALITGAARGQGRAHAVRLASEGADIIALDACAPMSTVPYRLAGEAELAETAALVEALGQRVVARRADVRDLAAVTAAVDEGVAELGRLDIVVANAGVNTPAPMVEMTEQIWLEIIDVDLNGVWRTCRAAIPHVIAGGRGGAIILTSSAAGLKAYANIAHYTAAKHGVVGLMKTLAQELAPHRIRVTTVNPTQVDTPMIMNEPMYRLFCPEVDNPTRADFAPVSRAMNALPIPWVEPEDVSNAVLFLASDEARYITGVALPVDAGVLVK